MSTDKQTEFWTSDETAAYLRLHPVTLRGWRHDRNPDQPPYIKAGTAVRYRIADVHRWAENRTHNPAGTAGRKDRGPGRQRGRPGPR